MIWMLPSSSDRIDGIEEQSCNNNIGHDISRPSSVWGWTQPEWGSFDLWLLVTDNTEEMSTSDNSDETSKLEEQAEELRKNLEQKTQDLADLEIKLREMNTVIQQFQDGEGKLEEEVDIVENGDKYLNDKDSLVFHGVDMDMLEEQTSSDNPDIRKNFMDHKIRSLLATKWEIECSATFKHVFRYRLGLITCHFLS